MKKELNIYDELSDVVTALKTPIAITNILETGGVSTITTETIRVFDNLSDTQDLEDGMIVTMDNVNYSVSNVGHTPSADTFDVTGIGLTASEWNVALNFQTGSRKEINQILEQDSGNLDRFPLLWLIPPTDLDSNNELVDFEASTILVFAHKANNTDRTATRITNNIKPVLNKLMKLFNHWLQSSDFNYMFEFNGYGKPIDYNRTEYPFYGTSDKTKSVLNIVTDAIEITYELKFKNQYIY